MPTAEHQKALKKGIITKTQYDKLPAPLLDAIIKKRGTKAKPHHMKTTIKKRRRRRKM